MSGRERISAPEYKQEGVVPFVINAVYAMAHALHDMINDLCHGQHICSQVNPPDGTALLHYIRNASFIGLSSTPTYLLSYVMCPAAAALSRVTDVRSPTASFYGALAGSWAPNLRPTRIHVRTRHIHQMSIDSCRSKLCRLNCTV